MKPIVLAGCVIVDDYGRILLLHRNTDQFQHWELPGGKVEKDETPEMTAVRELQEELGISVKLDKPLGNATFSDDSGDYHYFWFGAQIIAGQLTLMEPDKFDDFDYIDLEDLPSLSLSANMLILQPKLSSGEIVVDEGS